MAKRSNLALITLVLVSACGQAPTDHGATGSSVTPTDRPDTTPAQTPAMTTPVSTTAPEGGTALPPDTYPPMVQTAIDDLRTRLGDATAEITVISIDEVEWPDGSLGCPQPGMSYTQALVDGTKIVLSHAGIRYDYHQGGSRDVFYCPPATSK